MAVLPEAGVVATEGIKAAADTTKQIITLCTGVLAVTITFWDKVAGPAKSLLATGLLVAAWVVFGVTIVFGVLTLMALTGTQDAVDTPKELPAPKEDAPADLPATQEGQKEPEPSAYGGSVRTFAAPTVILFGLAMLLTIAAAVTAAVQTWRAPAAPAAFAACPAGQIACLPAAAAPAR